MCSSLNSMCGDKVERVRAMVVNSTAITPFQRMVYLELLSVPEGETISYGELARRIGCRSARAVGQALHRNPFAPDVPCHRVVRSDGTVGGYAFGQELKEELLRRERWNEKRRREDAIVRK